MKAPELPADEIDRLRSLEATVILDTPAEERFDRLTRLAKSIFDVDIALVSLVDRDRQWFKSRQGLEATETPRDVSFCGHAILERDIFEVSDARIDPRFADNPLVTGPPNVIFYAGAQLYSHDGYTLGTLCLIDAEPRTLTSEERQCLRDLADTVQAELQHSRVSQEVEALRVLTEITSQADIDPTEALRTALKLGCHYLGLEIGIISRIVENNYEVLLQYSPDGALSEGQQFELDHTYCALMLDTGGLLAIDDMAQSPYAEHPCYRGFALESYIGVPISLQRGFYGTLNFSAPTSRSAGPFTDVDFEFLTDLGHWVASMLKRWELNESLRRQTELNKAIALAQRQFIQRDDRSSGFDELLRRLLELTGSEYGFIGEVLHTDQGDPYLKTYAITNIAWTKAMEDFYFDNVEQGIEFHNLDTLFGAALRTRETVIANTPGSDSRRGGLPEGHPSLDAFLGMPIFHGTDMIAMAGIANRPRGYDSELVEYLKPLLATIGQFVQAVRDKEQIASHQKEVTLLSRVARETNNGVVITDVEGRITWVNEGFVRMSGFALSDVSGQTLGSLLRGSDAAPESTEVMTEAIAGEQVFEVELMHYSKSDAPYWIHINGSPLYSPAGEFEGYIAIETDIDERVRMQKLKDEFISTVSHELRTPLTSITGSLDLVLAKTGDALPAKGRQMLTIAQRNSERLTLLINDLLDVEKLVAGDMDIALEDQPLMPIIEQALDDNKHYAGKYGVVFDVTSVAEVTVSVDRHRLLQVLTNLLSNAVKFSDGAPRVQLAVTVEGSKVRVAVEDFGRGIPADVQDRVFDRFFQVDSSDSRERGGTGLGLAITRELIQKMRGTIAVNSREGIGSEFYFMLPLVEGECS